MPTPNRDEIFQQVVCNITEWDVSVVRAALDDHEVGRFGDSTLLVEAMERNPRIKGALETRSKGVTGLPFEMEPADDSAKAQEIAEDIEARWYSMFPEDVQADVLRTLIEMGFSHSQAVWYRDSKDRKWMPRVTPWVPYGTWYDEFKRAWFSYTQRQGNVQLTEGDGRWMLFRYSSTRTWMRGVVRCLGIEDSIRGGAVRDWARWSEKHGLPIMGAEIPSAQINTESAKAFFAALRRIGREGVIKLPKADGDGASFGLDYIEPKGISWQGFQKLIDFIANDVSIAILGQTLTTEVSGASLAAAKVHELVRQDYIRADVQALSTTIREQLLKLYVLYNYGTEFVELAPWPKWITELPEDRGKRATELLAVAQAVEKFAASAPNVDIDKLLDSFAIPLRVPVEQ